MIQHIYIDHYDEYDERQLEVAISGDVIFLCGGTVDHTYEKHTFEREENASIAVPVSDLINAIKILAISQHRDDLVAALGTDADLRPSSV